MQYWGAWGGGAYGADGGAGGGFPMAAAVAFRPAPALAVPYNHGMAPGGYAGPYNCDVRPPPWGRAARALCSQLLQAGRRQVVRGAREAPEAQRRPSRGKDPCRTGVSTHGVPLPCPDSWRVGLRVARRRPSTVTAGLHACEGAGRRPTRGRARAQLCGTIAQDLQDYRSHIRGKSHTRRLNTPHPG